MPEMDGSTRQPQISDMFHKFAFALKSKTFEFFAEEEVETAAAPDDGFVLLDSAEEFITDQKVVVIKPDQPNNPNPVSFFQGLLSSLFATLSSFEASYLVLQTAHVPVDEEAMVAADRALITHLQKLSDLRKLYKNFRKNPNFDSNSSVQSSLEAQVQENQSKLRALETMVNSLQSDIDVKEDDISVLRKKLNGIQRSNSTLSKKFSKQMKSSSDPEVLLTVRVFDLMLRDARKSLHTFTKLLIALMEKAGWDLDLAADSVHPDVDYAKKGHNRYAFLSFVCLVMFRGFDFEDFGLPKNETKCNGLVSRKKLFLKQLIEHVAGYPVELLRNDPASDFSRFCERKYEQVIHSTMETSIFSNLDTTEVVLDSWKSLSVFYESFVRMASAVWLLHKLAYSFDPVVEIFQVERGASFSMVYMEDVRRKRMLIGKNRPKVGFTVVPGFKIGRTVIQAQVYLTGLKCME